MASNDYLKLCEEAQKKKLKLMKKQEKQIKEIYNNMYLNISKKLSKVNPNTLTERYLQELKKVLEKEIKESSKQVKEVIKDNIEKSSKLANDTQLDFFMSINNKYNLNMEDTFSSMFSKIPKDAMNEILFGKVYKDRAGLSERIWLDTKKFNKDIDYVIAEGIANKKPTYEIAKDLEKYVNPNAAKKWEWLKVYPNANKVIDYNAQRLARTSIQHAFQQAQKRSCKKNPYIEYIKWLSSNTSRTCELCNSRDGQLFKIDEVPLDHPNGLCTTIPQIEKNLDEIGEELRNWVDGEANPMLDKWFKKYGEEFAGVKNDIPKETPSKASSNKKVDKIEKVIEKVKEFNFKNNKEANKFMVEKFGFEKSNIASKVDINIANSIVKKIDEILNKYPQLNGYVREFNSGAMKAYAYYQQELKNDNYKISLKISATHTSDLKDLIAMYERDLSKNFHPKGTTWEDIIVHEYGHAIEGYLGAKRAGVNNPKWDMSIEDGRNSIKYMRTGKISKEIIEEAFKNLNIKTHSDKYKITSELSKYATQDAREFLAEAFADAMSNKDNAQDISKEIIKIIDREMNK